MVNTMANREIGLLDQFRSKIEDIRATEELPDHFLIRWIRARNHDLAKAEEMLRNYICWKSTCVLLHESRTFTPSEYLYTNFRHKFTGVDKQGRVVLFIPFGRWELRAALEAGHTDDACRFQYKLLEKLVQEIEVQRKLCGQAQFVVVGDSAELTFWKLASIETIQMIMKFFREFESYYPELLHSCYILNTPLVFTYIFNIVKPLLSSHTLSKVQLFDYNREKWLSTLKEVLPDEAIPMEYGGTGEKIFPALN